MIVLPRTSRLLLVAVTMMVTCDQARPQGPIAVISAKSSLRLDHSILGAEQLGGQGDWSVTKSTLHGGKQEGVDVVTIDNGAIQIRLVPTRGMNIVDVRDSETGERLLGWDSPVHGIVHPRHIDLESRGGLGWLEGFNEWMVRCGLEFAGHPGTDQFVNNTGDQATMDLTLHGKIGNIPASEVTVSHDGGRIIVTGVVYESFFYGPKLRLTAELSTEPGSREFRMSDQITNLGAQPQEFQIIYHANFGAPLLEAGAKVAVPAKRLQPMNDHAAKSTASYSVYHAPTTGFVEEVYLVEPYSDEAGKTIALLENRSGTRGAMMSWSTTQLPYLTIWKNTAAKADGYVTGIEPATGYPFNRKIERKFGRVPKLDPGQTREFAIEVSVLDNQEAVITARRRIEKLQDGRKTERIMTPPQIDDDATTDDGAVRPDEKLVRYATRIVGRYDQNGDGVLVKSEWQSMLLRPEPADTDRDGRITVTEYALWMQSRKKAPPQTDDSQAPKKAPGGKSNEKLVAYATNIMSRYDQNGDGVLVESEWQMLLLDPSPADTDRDGRVTVTEYALWLRARTEQR